MSNDWLVRTYDKNNNQTDRWVIRDRTDSEARSEAESEIAQLDYVDDWTMMEFIPDSGICPCICGGTYHTEASKSEIRLVDVQKIGGKDHPCKGVIIGLARLYCKPCGASSSAARSMEGAITNWNNLMKPHN